MTSADFTNMMALLRRIDWRLETLVENTTPVELEPLVSVTTGESSVERLADVIERAIELATEGPP